MVNGYPNGMNDIVMFMKWHLNESDDKLGRVWSAQRDNLGIGRPPWTAGDVLTRASFDLFCNQYANPRRQYLFLPDGDDPNPDSRRALAL